MRICLMVIAYILSAQVELVLGTSDLSKGLIYRSSYWCSQVLIDAMDLQYNLFSVTSGKILAVALPTYMATRLLDEKIQCNFYDGTCHKNVKQLPQACHQIAKYCVGIPMVFLSSLMVWGWTDDLRYTARMTVIGLPFVHWGKNIIKHVQAQGCLRPWHEDFSKNKRSSGGFPSGHMANISFMTTLFGFRHGPKWAIPLGVFAGFIMVDFVNCNRHYASQIIAGAALGALYGFAASAVIDKRLNDIWSFSAGQTCSGAPCLEVSYAFS